jgi:hypothetical protein
LVSESPKLYDNPYQSALESGGQDAHDAGVPLGAIQALVAEVVHERHRKECGVGRQRLLDALGVAVANPEVREDVLGGRDDALEFDSGVP